MEQYRLWNTHMPRVQPYYAVKCNPDPVLLRWLARRGAAFDCASAREMMLVAEHFGGQPLGDKVLFANPCKTPMDIEVGKKLQVPWVTADSVEELVKMDRAGYRPDVLLRVAVDDRESVCPFGAKFGLQPDAVAEVAEAAKSFRIPVVGLSFHVGSGSKNPRAFREAVNTTKSLWSDLWKKDMVKTFKALDLGGGWSHEAPIFAEQARHASEALKDGPLPQKVIAEPGRFFAAPTHDLYVRVIGKKTGLGGKGWRYTLDESIYGQFSCIPWDHAMPLIARIREPGDDKIRPVTAATLFGRTCDSLDWIGNSAAMEELEVGDWLYVPNMGAYTTATSTEFNGFPKPDVVETEETPAASALKWLDTIQYPLAKMLSVKDI
jgi:ornithine decarboxylase